MKSLLRAIASLVLVATVNKPSAAGISIESRAEPTTIRIGDVVRYSIVVTHDESTEVQLPSPGENLGAFEIRDFNTFKPRKENGQIVEQADFLISTFDVGEYVIPPVRVLYRVRGDSSWREIRSQPISIHVESLNPDEAGDIRDIKPPLAIPFDWRRVAFWALLGLVGLAGVVAGIVLYRRYRRGEALLPSRVEPPRPAHEVALEELDALYHSDLIERGELKLLHIRLSDIVRRYIEGRFEVPALEMTTFEILDAFRDGRLSEPARSTLQSFLEACDLVKFAKYQPSPEEVKQTFQWAYDFVNETKPVVETPLQAEEGQHETAQAAEAVVEQTSQPEGGTR